MGIPQQAAPACPAPVTIAPGQIAGTELGLALDQLEAAKARVTEA